MMAQARRAFAATALALVTIGVIGGCTSSTGGGAGKSCVPGQQIACACPGGAMGAQACLMDGTGYGPCMGCGPMDLAGGGGDLAGADLAVSDGSPGDGAGADLSSQSGDLSTIDASMDAPPSTDLSGRDSSGADLASGDLAVADLAIADLAVADLAIADLTRVDLAGPVCGRTNCLPGLICCLVPDTTGLVPTCMTSAACAGDGGGWTGGSCGGPDDCPQSNPPTGGCCYASGIVPAPDGGTLPERSAECSNPCPGYVGVNLSGQLTGIETELCHTGADCTGYQGTYSLAGSRSTVSFNRCCQQTTGLPFRSCVPSTVVSLLPSLFKCF